MFGGEKEAGKCIIPRLQGGQRGSELALSFAQMEKQAAERESIAYCDADDLKMQVKQPLRKGKFLSLGKSKGQRCKLGTEWYLTNGSK